MPSWNRRFFIPSLLLSCIVLSGAVLAQPKPQLQGSSLPVEFLPAVADRTVLVEVTEESPELAVAVETERALNTAEPKPVTASTPVGNPEPLVNNTIEPVEETAGPEPAKVKVKLVIQGPAISRSGIISVAAGSSVYQVLRKASNQLDFSLKTSQHSSLGMFVEGIAGIRNNPKTNSYWLYYVNGQFASRGVSLQTVQEGDTITWSYE